MTIREMIEALEKIEKEEGSDLKVIVGADRIPNFYIIRKDIKPYRLSTDKLAIISGMRDY